MSFAQGTRPRTSADVRVAPLHGFAVLADAAARWSGGAARDWPRRVASSSARNVCCGLPDELAHRALALTLSKQTCLRAPTPSRRTDAGWHEADAVGCSNRPRAKVDLRGEGNTYIRGHGVVDGVANSHVRLWKRGDVYSSAVGPTRNEPNCCRTQLVGVDFLEPVFLRGLTTAGGKRVHLGQRNERLQSLVGRVSVITREQNVPWSRTRT